VKASVLLIDDDPSVLSALARLLSREGYELLTAGSGSQALAILARADVAAIVCDQRMQGMTGTEVLEAACRLRPDAARILLTAYGDLKIAQTAINRARASYFLLKPWDDEHLRTVVREAVRQFQARREIQRLHELTRQQRDQLEEWNRRLEDMVRQRTAEMRTAYDDTLHALALALDAREHATGSHSWRVAVYCLYLAQEIGIPAPRLEALYRGALLHDLGKIGVPDAVLLKPAKLDAEERQIMQRHVVIGGDLLERVSYLRPAATIPRYHHERYDGTGYCAGRAGEAIPLEARCFAIIDVYDALRSPRPYKDPLPDEHARAIIAAESGRHFDPQIARRFLAVPEQTWAALAAQAGTAQRFAGALRICQRLHRQATGGALRSPLSVCG
jgi:response regulator RpfG family c-di-GMP phosphodiesterase